MKKKNIIKGGILAFSTLLVVSCDSKGPIDVDLNTSDTTATTIPKEDISTGPKTEYSVPTPNELFTIVKDLGGKLNIELINSVDNKDNYITTSDKALNFGVYSADIGYMSCFEHNLDFIKYTKVIESLGNDLGISEVFDEELMEKVLNNEDNSDSLFLISNDTYYDNYQYLEDNEKGTELALIISGGYIESLYIVTNLINSINDNAAIGEKIGDQKLVLENIISFCGQYQEDPAVSEMIADLMDLGDTFEMNMDFIEGTSKATEDEDGIVSLSSGGHFEMNEEAFKEVKAKINELRTKITQK